MFIVLNAKPFWRLFLNNFIMTNKDIHKLYEHCKLRAKERYDYSLTRKSFETISLDIRNFKYPGINIMLFSDVSSKRNQHWIVKHDNKWFYVVYDMFAKFCTTFMPLEDLQKKQMKISRGCIAILKQRNIL